MRKFSKFFVALAVVSLVVSCRNDDDVISSEEEQVGTPEPSFAKGFYLLNEGNMGSNKSTLDYMDLETGVYKKNIYAEANPTMVKELGDVGNDIKIYGNKIYAVINASNFIEVMDKKTAKHLGKISLQNGRYLTFKDGKGYATSYAGPISTDPNAPLGKVVEFDTINYNIQREVTVGYQPDGIEVVGNNLYVANSGGYRYPDYDKTVSVIDIPTFTESKKIDVQVNLHHIKKDSEGDLYVSSRGDYYQIASNLYVVDSKTHQVKKTFDLPVSNFTIVGDKLYYYSNEFSYETFEYELSFGVIDTKTEQVIKQNFINATSLANIQTPYGIAVNPNNGDIYLTDVGNYVSSGYVYCFDKEGNEKWKVEAGNIPAHIAFDLR